MPHHRIEDLARYALELNFFWNNPSGIVDNFCIVSRLARILGIPEKPSKRLGAYSNQRLEISDRVGRKC